MPFEAHTRYIANRAFSDKLKVQKIEGKKIENSGISHIRYNYRIAPRIAWEVFAQGQYNKISFIVFRGILGTDPRFKLTKSENYKFYLGTLVMYEYEE